MVVASLRSAQAGIFILVCVFLGATFSDVYEAENAILGLLTILFMMIVLVAGTVLLIAIGEKIDTIKKENK